MQILTCDVFFFLPRKSSVFQLLFFPFIFPVSYLSEKEFPDTYAARQTRREKNVLSFL